MLRGDRALALEAVAWLALARAALLGLRFGRIARHLGRPMQETGIDGDPRDAAIGGRVGWAIGAAARRVPWRTECLEQALAAEAMLRRRRVPCTMYVGVARNPGAGVDAHAWLRTGRLHVTGGADVTRYAVLATFAATPKPR